MRYIKATLVIGSASLLAALLLDATGWIQTAESVLGGLFSKWSPGLTGTPPLVAYAVAALVAYGIAWVAVDITRFGAKFWVGASAWFLVLSGSWVLSLYGVYISPFQALVAGGLSLIIGLFYSRSQGGVRKSVLIRLIGQRLPARHFRTLVDSDEPVSFPGNHRDATVVVCEIANYDALLNSMVPEDAVAMTNRFLDMASNYLVECGGYLDLCAGGTVRVVYGAPLESGNHAETASKAVLGLLSRVDELNRECDSTWQQRIRLRAGVDSGPLLVGAFGGSRLGGVSVVGPVVDFANRLCAACDQYGCRVLIGPDTFRLAHEEFESRPIEMLSKHDGRRVELYEILAPKDGLTPEGNRSRKHFWNGVIFFREQKWQSALDEFALARIVGIADPALDFYILRSERARRGEAPDETVPVFSTPV